MDVTGANVESSYIGDFSDEATGKVERSSLKEGCDILFVTGCCRQRNTAVKESGGNYVIGCDVNRFDDGVVAANIILTSVLKVMDINVSNNTIYDGTFVGQGTLLGVEVTRAVMFPKRQTSAFDDTLNKLAECYKRKDGTIVQQLI